MVTDGDTWSLYPLGFPCPPPLTSLPYVGIEVYSLVVQSIGFTASGRTLYNVRRVSYRLGIRWKVGNVSGYCYEQLAIAYSILFTLLNTRKVRVSYSILVYLLSYDVII